MIPIRIAASKDLARVQDIEIAAGKACRAWDMAEIADDDPPSIETLTSHSDAGTIWVAVDAGDVPASYLMAGMLSDFVHIEQVTVHPEAAMRGICRMLIDHLDAWARERGCPALTLTLTTFRDIPWNAPYYARLGFAEIVDADLPSPLRDIVAQESTLALSRWPRPGPRAR